MELEAAVRMRPRSSRDCFSDSCRSLAENRRVVLSRHPAPSRRDFLLAFVEQTCKPAPGR